MFSYRIKFVKTSFCRLNLIISIVLSQNLNLRKNMDFQLLYTTVISINQRFYFENNNFVSI